MEVEAPKVLHGRLYVTTGAIKSVINWKRPEYIYDFLQFCYLILFVKLAQKKSSVCRYVSVHCSSSIILHSHGPVFKHFQFLELIKII
jgi:hypothetical protein